MNRKIEEQLKQFYKTEAAAKEIPPMPVLKKEKRNRGENLLLASCILGCLLCLSRPAVYDNALRQLSVSTGTIETLREDFSRVIFEASREYKESKGVYHD